MMWGPFAGLKPQDHTTVALVWRKEEVSPASSLFKQELLEVGLQGGSGLLEHAAGQLGGVSQPLIVQMIADLAMGSPDGVGQALALPMGGEVALLSRHPRNDERLSSQANHSGESGSKLSSPSCGQITT
jgi:hypothetical protein